MRKTELRFLAQACGGELLGCADNRVSGVKIDSREVKPGDLFVAVIGENNDGHRFYKKAYENGARSFLFSDAEAAREAAELEGAAVVLAEDTSEAFKDMAAAYLQQFDLIRVGVTGSVGKTSTRQLTAAVLSEKYKTVCSQKNLNTHLGLCMTAFLADETTQAIVFEMGMDRKGEIAGYVEWARPQAAIITNVGISHMERLGSRDAIADAKLEITGRLTDGQPLIYNCGSDYLSEEEIRRRAPGPYKCVPAGAAEGALVRAYDVKERGLDGISFSLKDERSGETARVDLPLMGAHNAVNSALAAACGAEFGIDLKTAARGLEHVVSTERRLIAERLAGDIILLDDSYNASPDSMVSGLSALASVKASRHIAVLGDMYELGSAEDEGHIRVGRAAAEKKTDFIVAVGKKTAYYAKGAAGSQTQVLSFVDVETASACMDSLLRPGDAVLVKGSNSTGVSAIAKKLREDYKAQE